MKTFPDKMRIAVWALLLLAGQALQVIATTHWHGTAHVVAATVTPPTPSPDLPGHDVCPLCQAAAHSGGSAPPPAPWVLHVAHEPRGHILHAPGIIAVVLRPSHAWQGRAPPRV